MKLLTTRVCALALSLFIEASIAGEYQRLLVDLDGDAKPETITVSTNGSGDFHNFTIRIGAAKYTGQFFFVEGDLPKLSVIAIDRHSAVRQLLVTTLEAASCDYHVLAYLGGKIHPLLEPQSDSECVEPQSLGNGTMNVGIWESFWRRNDNYRLNSTGTKLIRVPQTLYEVNINSVALNDFSLTPERCEKKTVTKGEFIRIETFDASKHLYLIKTYGGACGWIEADRIRGHLGELPWAN